MKILVFGQPLDIGGTQVNGIELAAALQDNYGHEVVYFASPGPMIELIHEKGLRYLPAPPAMFHPSLGRMRALSAAIKSERPDIIHVWDWVQCLDAYYIGHLVKGIPMAVTDMMMELYRLLPKSLPTTYGTPDLFDQARASGRKRVELILPHVDVHANAPGAVDPEPFRQQHRIQSGEITLVTVSRLAAWMKGESLRRTISALGSLGRELPLRLIIVGDGNARAQLQVQADAVNTELGREAVLLAGALNDPRPAYAAADIVIGMGGSALRGMAFNKPVIIVGERGFCRPFNPATVDYFSYYGMYGIGDGNADNSRLVDAIRSVAQRPDQFAALGEFSRDFVVSNFALERVSEKLEKFLRQVASEAPRFHVAALDGLRTAALWVKERRFVPGEWRHWVSGWKARLGFPETN